MRIAFIGLGSIAKKHIRNLRSVLDERRIEACIDVIRHSSNSVDDTEIESFIDNVYDESQIEKQIYDIIFVTNPTSKHYDTIKKYVSKTKHMFIEKPVFDICDADIDELHLKSNSIYYVACPLRYIPVIQYALKNIELKNVFSARAICSSYLPDWRPGIDYRKCYSAHKDMGGGVAIDLIHEWDYLCTLFGFPKKVIYAGGKYSTLEIDSDDIATYIGVYDDRLVELHLDYFGRKLVREVELYLPDETIKIDIANNNIVFYKSGNKIDIQEELGEHNREELRHFLDIIDGKVENDNSIVHAQRVLAICREGME